MQIHRLTDRRVFTIKKHSRFDLSKSVQNFIKYREEAVERRMGKGEYAAARTQKMIEQASLLKLQRLEREGRLIPDEDVGASWSAIFGVFKTRLLAVPSRAASKVVRIKSAPEAMAIIRSEIYDALDYLSKMKGRAIRPGRAPRRGNGHAEEEGEEAAVK
jgi:hypothetical protein